MVTLSTLFCLSIFQIFKPINMITPILLDFLQGSMSHIVAEIATSIILVIGGYFVGKVREKRKLSKGKNLDEYDFYPFSVNRENFSEFDLSRFRLGMHYFMRKYDYTAARQLIFIGEQHRVNEHLDTVELKVYHALFHKYNGHTIEADSVEFLENYKRIVRLIGNTFRNMGIEILLHDLMNPSRSVVAIEGGATTGRTLGNGTTSLVIDLKKRKMKNEDKLNYELNIGSRKFKCTTIPIFRKEYDLVGAICINIDTNYITDYVKTSPENLDAFFKSYCETEMNLDENILSRDEFEKAKKGKRHWKDVV